MIGRTTRTNYQITVRQWFRLETKKRCKQQVFIVTSQCRQDKEKKEGRKEERKKGACAVCARLACESAVAYVRRHRDGQWRPVGGTAADWGRKGVAAGTGGGRNGGPPTCFRGAIWGSSDSRREKNCVGSSPTARDKHAHQAFRTASSVNWRK